MKNYEAGNGHEFQDDTPRRIESADAIVVPKLDSGARFSPPQEAPQLRALNSTSDTGFHGYPDNSNLDEVYDLDDKIDSLKSESKMLSYFLRPRFILPTALLLAASWYIIAVMTSQIHLGIVVPGVLFVLPGLVFAGSIVAASILFVMFLSHMRNKRKISELGKKRDKAWQNGFSG